MPLAFPVAPWNCFCPHITAMRASCNFELDAKGNLPNLRAVLLATDPQSGGLMAPGAEALGSLSIARSLA